MLVVLICTMNSQIESYLNLIGNQSLDSDVCSRHEFPDLIFSKLYGKFDTVNVSRSMRSTRYDSSKDIETIHLGTVFLYIVNIL